MLEHIERRFVLGQSDADETQTTAFGMGVGFPVFGEHFVAGLHALESSIVELCEVRRAQQVGPFLLRRLLLAFRHATAPQNPSVCERERFCLNVFGTLKRRRTTNYEIRCP